VRLQVQLAGKIALVTGGSEGMGAGLIQALAAEGASVVAVARNEQRLAEVIGSLPEGLRQQVTAVIADVRNEDQVRSAVARTLQLHGTIDILLNCAGVSMREPSRLEHISSEDWDRIIDTNLYGTFLLCREVIPAMTSQNFGYIINILSTAAYRANKENSLYTASKYGARALTEALIEEHKGSGVRISSVSPGPVNTNIWSHKIKPVTEEQRASMLEVKDIVRIVLFLLTQPDYVQIDNITVAPGSPKL
jgi:NADP-dependent 3-hydroxy acid dehydrogenase YdfG